MLIDTVYKKLYDQHLCKSAYDFSVRFLGKSKSYYSVIKARNDIPSIEAISTLETALKNTSLVYDNNKFPYYPKTRDSLLKMSADVARYREQRSNELLSQHAYHF